MQEAVMRCAQFPVGIKEVYLYAVLYGACTCTCLSLVRFFFERIHVCVHLYLILCLWLKYMYLLVAIYKASKLHCV